MATDIRALAMRFEPILHFHKDERFFPSDAKRYFEQSELWKAVGDANIDMGAQRTLKDNWGSQAGNRRIPMLARGEVSVEIGELGNFIDTTGSFVADDDLEERFLNPVGWRGGDIVDAASENGYADLDRLATLYNASAAQGGDDALNASRFWYHAEFFTAERLKKLLGDQGEGHDRSEAAKLFDDATTDPALLCYYFFFPGHEEGLAGCSNNAALSWASCAGSWQCLAILLDRASQEVDYMPKVAALTNRRFRAAGFIGQEPRVGMRSNVADWTSIATVDDHPMIFVARGTHGLYFSDQDEALIISAADDSSVRNCGRYEGVAAFESDQGPSDSHEELLIKVLAGAAAGGFAGAALGLFLAVQESQAALSDIKVVEGEPGVDELPKGQFGRVVCPPGVNSPLAPAAPGPSWPRFTDDPNDPMTTVIGARRYSLILGTKSDPLAQTARPAWLPGIDLTSGFRGRWGNRVTRDPFSRRAGARFPDFASMFLSAFAVSLSS